MNIKLKKERCGCIIKVFFQKECKCGIFKQCKWNNVCSNLGNKNSFDNLIYQKEFFIELAKIVKQEKFIEDFDFKSNWYFIIFSLKQYLPLLDESALEIWEYRLNYKETKKLTNIEENILNNYKNTKVFKKHKIQDNYWTDFKIEVKNIMKNLFKDIKMMNNLSKEERKIIENLMMWTPLKNYTNTINLFKNKEEKLELHPLVNILSLYKELKNNDFDFIKKLHYFCFYKLYQIYQIKRKTKFSFETYLFWIELLFFDEERMSLFFKEFDIERNETTSWNLKIWLRNFKSNTDFIKEMKNMEKILNPLFLKFKELSQKSHLFLDNQFEENNFFKFKNEENLEEVFIYTLMDFLIEPFYVKPWIFTFTNKSLSSYIKTFSKEIKEKFKDYDEIMREKMFPTAYNLETNNEEFYNWWKESKIKTKSISKWLDNPAYEIKSDDFNILVKQPLSDSYKMKWEIFRRKILREYYKEFSTFYGYRFSDFSMLKQIKTQKSENKPKKQNIEKNKNPQTSEKEKFTCGIEHNLIDENLRIQVSKELTLNNFLTYDEIFPFIARFLEIQKYQYDIHFIENITFIFDYLFFNEFNQKIILDHYILTEKGMNIKNVCSNFEHLLTYNKFFIEEYKKIEEVYTLEELKEKFIKNFKERFKLKNNNGDFINNTEEIWNIFEKTMNIMEKSTKTNLKWKRMEMLITKNLFISSNNKGKQIILKNIKKETMKEDMEIFKKILNGEYGNNIS